MDERLTREQLEIARSDSAYDALSQRLIETALSLYNELAVVRERERQMREALRRIAEPGRGEYNVLRLTEIAEAALRTGEQPQ